MIVCTYGTIIFPFDRATNWLLDLLEAEIINEPVLLQHGASAPPTVAHPLLECVPSLTKEEMIRAVSKASLVITHAGQGSTRMLAELNASFVLLPRLKQYKEHIDDHQLLFARSISRFGIEYCTQFEQLAAVVRNPPAPFGGKLFDEPLLVEHLIGQYGKKAAPERSYYPRTALSN
jgi:UDP-N-acetylglucosamine transferase subunit ALG13